MNPVPIRTLQIILLALVMGLTCFTGLVAYLRTTQAGFGAQPASDVLTLLVPIFFVGNAVACLFIQSVAKKAVLAERESARMLLKRGSMPPALARAAILGAALAEGGGLFGTVVVLIGGPLFLFAAPAVSVIWMLLLFPTLERIENRLKDVG